MGRVLVSTVIDAPAGDVWEVIRTFDSMNEWYPRPGRSVEIEDGKAGDQVSAIRHMRENGETRGRERLLSHSDAERTFSYEIAEPVPGYDIETYRATVSVRPVTDSNRAYVEWQAVFESDLDRREHWEQRFGTDTFGGQAAALAAYFAQRAA
jgi:hypothetical protein